MLAVHVGGKPASGLHSLKIRHYIIIVRRVGRVCMVHAANGSIEQTGNSINDMAGWRGA